MEDIMTLIVRNDLESIKSLIEQKKFNVNDQDRDGNTALMYAVAGGFLEIVKYLIAEGADANLQEREGQTALMIAIGIDEKIVRVLIEEAHANLDLIDKSGKTALMIAVGYNNESIVEMLYQSHASVLIKDNFSKTVGDLMSDSNNINSNIKDMITKRIQEIELAINFVYDLTQTNPTLSKESLSRTDLEMLSSLLTINRNDFILASFERMANTIDVWDKISELKYQFDEDGSTDSEASDVTVSHNLILKLEMTDIIESIIINVELLAELEGAIDAI